ncbi:MAG: ArsR/SmtB family transcription factor [Planctomycetota bacterium]|jgi:ArsR family transcriptional regulator
MIDELATTADSVGDVVGLLRTLSDPTRLRLLGILQHGERNVTGLCRQLGLPQPTISHHLGLLRSAGLVANRRSGKQVFYSLNPDTVSRFNLESGLAIAAGPLELHIRNPNADGEDA